jgi:hypothetical protein
MVGVALAGRGQNWGRGMIKTPVPSGLVTLPGSAALAFVVRWREGRVEV